MEMVGQEYVEINSYTATTRTNAESRAARPRTAALPTLAMYS